MFRGLPVSIFDRRTNVPVLGLYRLTDPIGALPIIIKTTIDLLGDPVPTHQMRPLPSFRFPLRGFMHTGLLIGHSWLLK